MREREKKSRVADVLKTMEYGPAPEAAGPAIRWLEAHGRAFGTFVDGGFTAPGELFDSLNPATGEPLAKLTQATPADVDAAVAAARRAQAGWAALSGHARARHLYAIARHVQKHARLFAVLETLDNGKPIRETRDIDVPLVARHFYHHAGWAELRDTELPGARPVGVVGQIIPWNFPLLMLAWKIAPALAMGNTVVLKPAEWTSLTALLFAEVCRDVGLPPGVVNVVTGDGRVGERIVRHPGVDKIAFTGSTEVGRILREATAGSGKKLSLELGGKSPFVVFDSADLDSVVEGVVDAIWFNQGQVCCAGSRLLVQESVAPRLLAKLRARMEKLRLGDPLDKAIDIGAIIAPAQLKKIEGLVKQGAAEGAELWQPSWSCPKEGWFYPPTILSGVAPSSTVAQVEIFGPVLVTLTFRTPQEAVALANNTRYGLAASVWSEDVNLSLDVARQVKAGVVWVNSTNLFDAASGFGGYRESGFGREGGREGLFEYVRTAFAPAADAGAKAAPAEQAAATASAAGLPPIDRTAKLFIGGRQARPDSGYSRKVLDPHGRSIGDVGEGSRKDLRNAVEAARAASGWASQTAHNRAQILYYLGENLSARAEEMATRVAAMTGDATGARAEVEGAVQRLFACAAWADKYDGAVHHTPLRNVTLAMNEAVGTVGVLCPDEAPLLAFVTLVGGAIAMGNTVVAVPSERHPLAATDLYQVLETSDVPAGVVNIVTGGRDELAKVLAEHADVDACWYFGGAEGAALVERASVSNLKQTWTTALPLDWAKADLRVLLRHATQVKNIWVPYGA
ncbi:MAG: aldehyde dehydrogenase family protein [Vicinamibacteria bacterium]